MGLYEIMAAPSEVLDRCTLYENLPSETLTLYNDLWTELGCLLYTSGEIFPPYLTGDFPPIS